jgi:Methyltransferase FkbM domain
MIRKVIEIFRDQGGISGLAKRSLGLVYRASIRRLLPVVGPVRYSGIAISKDRRWGDLTIPVFMAPFMGRDIHNYEEALIGGIRSNVRRGDTVVVVGAGEGVTTTIAAQAAGDGGSVICFEGSEDFARDVRVTAARNGVGPRVTVHHAIVGKNINVYGHKELNKSAKLLAPEDLPNCDVLEMDCEGAEIEILDRLKFFPRVILVETHGVHGAPTDNVRKMLESRGYDVADLGWAEPNRLDECICGDIKVLSAQQPAKPR